MTVALILAGIISSVVAVLATMSFGMALAGVAVVSGFGAFFAMLGLIERVIQRAVRR